MLGGVLAPNAWGSGHSLRGALFLNSDTHDEGAVGCLMRGPLRFDQLCWQVLFICAAPCHAATSVGKCMCENPLAAFMPGLLLDTILVEELLALCDRRAWAKHGSVIALVPRCQHHGVFDLGDVGVGKGERTPSRSPAQITLNQLECFSA